QQFPPPRGGCHAPPPREGRKALPTVTPASFQDLKFPQNLSFLRAMRPPRRGFLGFFGVGSHFFTCPGGLTACRRRERLSRTFHRSSTKPHANVTITINRTVSMFMYAPP